MQAVIMVAGKSTRTYPLTLTRPKPLLPIINRPMIYFNLDQLVGLVDEVILIDGYKKEMLETEVGDYYRGMHIIYQEQREQLGTGHAVLQAAPHIRGRFFVMNGDDLFARVDMERMMTYSYAALAMRAPNPEQFGIVVPNEQGHLIDFVEKPKVFISDLVNVGCYVFEPAIFDVLEKVKPSVRGEIELPDAVLDIARREPVQVVSSQGYWLPTGYPWYMLTTERYLYDHYSLDFSQNGEVESDIVIDGSVAIGQGTVVKAGTRIQGPVTIGDHCVIGPGVKINPYSSIGSHVTIRAGSMIENSILFNNVVVGENTDIRHSIIGENSHVGDSCKLKSTPNKRSTVLSVVKEKPVDTGLAQFGATLADAVRLEDSVTLEPGVKIWPGIRVAAGQSVSDDIMAE